MLSAFRSAVNETMREMEAEMKTRVRRKVAEFESQAALKEWLSKNAPAFL
jgi:hypothetical protein